MDEYWYLKVGLIIAGAYAVFWEIMEWRRLLKITPRPNWIWVKAGFSVMMIYWSVFYFRSLIGINIGSIHQVWVRAPLLITIMLIGASASLSWFRHRSKKP